MANGGIIGPVNDPLVYTTSNVTSFTASGTFSKRAGQNTVDYLVIAGGGAGGFSRGGGGGAGGYRTSFPGGTQLSVPSSSVSVTVGGGGAANASPVGGGKGSLKSDNNNNKAWVGRIVASPATNQEIGLSGYTGAYDSDGNDINGIGVDVLTTVGSFELTSEYATFNVPSLFSDTTSGSTF